ncbi:hypothetical protein [Dulcicalothrix desertica]|nr:hypothetical protein [Dulcicalothrix desertica]TWH43435.1 hypothetical protein CAL7102_07155 [Dulcicalothrix desertica PCC 7102]
MPDWNAIEKSFLRIGRQQQLGELASSLSNITRLAPKLVSYHSSRR